MEDRHAQAPPPEDRHAGALPRHRAAPKPRHAQSPATPCRRAEDLSVDARRTEGPATPNRPRAAPSVTFMVEMRGRLRLAFLKKAFGTLCDPPEDSELHPS